jgi:hypothetical protein
LLLLRILNACVWSIVMCVCVCVSVCVCVCSMGGNAGAETLVKEANALTMDQLKLFIDDEFKSRADGPLNRLASDASALQETVFSHASALAAVQVKVGNVKTETLSQTQTAIDNMEGKLRGEIDEIGNRTLTTIKPQLVSVQVALQTLKHEFPQEVQDMIKQELSVSVQPVLTEHDGVLDKLGVVSRRLENDLKQCGATVEANMRSTTEHQAVLQASVSKLVDLSSRLRSEAQTSAAHHDAQYEDLQKRLANVATVADQGVAAETRARETALATQGEVMRAEWSAAVTAERAARQAAETTLTAWQHTTGHQLTALTEGQTRTQTQVEVTAAEMRQCALTVTSVADEHQRMKQGEELRRNADAEAGRALRLQLEAVRIESQRLITAEINALRAEWKQHAETQQSAHVVAQANLSHLHEAARAEGQGLFLAELSAVKAMALSQETQRLDLHRALTHDVSALKLELQTAQQLAQHQAIAFQQTIAQMQAASNAWQTQLQQQTQQQVSKALESQDQALRELRTTVASMQRQQAVLVSELAAEFKKYQTSAKDLVAQTEEHTYDDIVCVCVCVCFVVAGGGWK